MKTTMGLTTDRAALGKQRPGGHGSKCRPLGAVAIMTVLVAAVGACGTGEAGEAPVQTTAVVERGDLRITAEATGSVEPVRQVEVKSKASGEILRLHADVGDRVEPGTLLAEVDPRDVRNSHQQVQADMAVTEERRNIAERQLERQEELAAAGVITQRELESARLEFATAEANLIKARTSLDLAELQLNDVTIRSPMAGTILSRTVEEGTVIQSASQNVSGGSVLFTMASLDAMQVRTLVDETDMGELQAGMEATVTVEAYPDRAFQGRVDKIEPQAVVQQNVTMFPVIVRLENQEGLLKPGMNAEVEILIDQASDVVLVPNNAIVNTEDVGPAAMVLGLDVESMDLTGFQQARRFGGALAGRRGPGPEDAEGASGADGTPSRGDADGQDQAATNGPGPGPEGEGRAAVAALRERVEQGEVSRDSLRAVMERRRAEGGGSVAAGRGPGAFGGAEPAGARRIRRVVVFVVPDSLSRPEPRLVEIGLNDWDRTQVVSGLEEGEAVALVGAAQLQAQQDEFMDRMRGRRGGMPFGR